MTQSSEKEYLDYENVTNISNDLKKIAIDVEQILNNINKHMQKINTEDYYKSNASQEIINKFKLLSDKFYKYYKEIETNALYLDRKIVEYDIRTNATKNYIEDTTSSYLERLDNYGK